MSVKRPRSAPGSRRPDRVPERAPEEAPDTTGDDLNNQVQAESENNSLVPANHQSVPQGLLVSLTSSVCSSSMKRLTAHHRHCQNFEIRRPDPVWHHPLGRNKYKYFLEQPTSLTGAGRDISFLCDAVVTPRKARPLPPVRDKNSLDKQNVCVSANVIPEEYRIVKKKGIKCLEFYEDAFTVQLKDQEQKLQVLPAMRPSGRLEVIQLMRMMDDMLENAGVDQQNEELTELCQLEGLLELVEAEQNIYNMVFHELIRQVAVGCAERGQLLAKLRQRYQSLLDRIPRRLKALHTETVAQRALDRRLTEEIYRIKASIQLLHMEISKIRDHDVFVFQQVEHAHQKLSEDLSQTHSSSDVVQGYHELYELHRARLEAQLLQMTEDRDCWRRFTLRLALKVIDVKKMHLVDQLHVSEKGWFKAAEHCLLYLSSKDTEDLNVISELTSYWKEQLIALVSQLKEAERAQCAQITAVQQGIAKWVSFLNTQNKCPDPKYDITSVEAMSSDLKQWRNMLGVQWEEYQGENQLLCQQKLSELSQVLEKWLFRSLELYERHPSPDVQALDGQQVLRELDRVLTELLKQIHVQVSGKSGIFSLIKSLVKSMELWMFKTSSEIGQFEMTPVSDWLQLEEELRKWQSLAEEALLLFSFVQKENANDKNKFDLHTQTKKALDDIQETTSSLSNFIECENQKLTEGVTSVHVAQTRWMLNLVLVLVPDQSEEQNQLLEPDSISLQTLDEGAQMLSEKLICFSSHITRSCSLILEEKMLLDLDKAVCENEMNECKKLQRESVNWVDTCKMLVSGVNSEPLEPSTTAALADVMETQVKEESSMKLLLNEVKDLEDETESDPVKVELSVSEKPVVKLINVDGNITQRELGESQVHLSGTEELVEFPATGEAQRAFNQLTTIAKLQQDMIDSEVRVNGAEQRALKAEDALQAALEKIQELERRLQSPTGPEPQRSEDPKKTPPSPQTDTTPAPQETTSAEAKPSSSSKTSKK